MPQLSVAEGWTKVREDAVRRGEESEEWSLILEKLQESEDKAHKDGKGLWTLDGDKIQCSYEVSDVKGLVDKVKGKPVDGVVEKVLGGDRLLVRLTVTPTEHVQTLLVVAGIRAPSTKRIGADGSEQPGEPYGDQAYQFVESRLLQRKVKVTLVGTTPQNLVGTVMHPNGNIAKFLLEAGLARCADFHSTMLGADMIPLRQAEKLAKDSRKGLFTGHVASKPAGIRDTDLIVSRVVSADTLFVRTKNGAENRISLSSVRQPKPSDPAQAPFAPEAKEFLRKKVIGKHVKVTIDGKRPASEGFDEREMATVTFGGTNLALALVEIGYLSVIRHRRDDEDRSDDYDALLQAEEVARKGGKGMWSQKPPKAKPVLDYSESVQRAKIHASVMQRQRRLPGIVDFVKSGARFTIFLPQESAKLTLVLSGIRAPRSARSPNESSEPFGQEAHDLAIRRCMQRDVEVDIETIDKVGGFIGTLYINRENFAKLLLEEGLARVHSYSAEQSGNARELFAAEQKAKDARKGLWHDWDPSQDIEEDVDAQEYNPEDASSAETTQRRKDYRDVIITSIDQDCQLKMQLIGPGTSALTQMMNAFRSFHISNKEANGPLPSPPKVGDLVSARFTEDNEWYRAKVRRNDRDNKTSDVLYIDYGNKETVTWSRLRPLAPQFSVAKLPGQASTATLSLIQFPQSAEYLSEAAAFIGEQTFGRQIVANIDYVTADGTPSVTLLDPSASKNLDESINGEVVAEGLAMVPRKLKAWERSASAAESLSYFKKLEKQAKDERKGMWEYGDITED